MKIRNCPNCNSEITYSNKYSYQTGLKKNALCKTCALRKISRENVSTGRLSGKNSPNFGKKYSEERKKHISENHADVNGEKNPMFGKSVYDCWVTKYGKELADKKLIEYKHKKSLENIGKNNNMFGKPSPQGSGNGWSGWYKGWYFRSLLELSYMIKVIERFNLKWESAEQRKWSIPYKNWEGKDKTYFADFIIEGKYLVECKPKKLHGSVAVQFKANGAKVFCGYKKLKYKLRCITILDKTRIKRLVETGQIKFLPRYQKRFEEQYKNI